MSRHLGSLVLACALLLSAVACSDDTPEEPEQSPSSGDSSTPPETTEPTTEPTTGPPVPSVTPAAGLELRQGNLSVRAPQGWRKTPEPSVGGFSEQADDAATFSSLFVSELPDVGGEVDIDELARSVIRAAHYPHDPDILEPVTLDGVEWYHTSGPVNPPIYEDAYGTVAGGFQFRLTLSTPIDGMSTAEREELLASILATVQLDVG